MLKKVGSWLLGLLELSLNLVILGYGPFVVYKSLITGEYVSAVFLWVIICVICYLNYNSPRLRKFFMGSFFKIVISLEAYRYKNERRFK